jgi:hypothetical protein
MPFSDDFTSQHLRLTEVSPTMWRVTAGLATGWQCFTGATYDIDGGQQFLT